MYTIFITITVYCTPILQMGSRGVNKAFQAFQAFQNYKHNSQIRNVHRTYLL